MTSETSFPRLLARTLNFTLGLPRNLHVTHDGSRVLFVRTTDGESRTGILWEYDVATGTETPLVDPAELLGGDEELSADERARRERARETGGGIVAYSCDAADEHVVFALSGALWMWERSTAYARRLPNRGSVIDPRIDPTGRHVAYASDGALRIIGTDGTLDHALVDPDGDDVVWGQAEFVAAEEMERYRGFWWAPDGRSLLVERYDDAEVATWYVADPANPDREPVRHRYPAAGTADSDVSLWHLTLDGVRTRVSWDDARFPYLTRVSWSDGAEPVIQVMSREQKDARHLAVDVAGGETTELRAQHDDVWLDLVPGSPVRTAASRLITVEDHDDRKAVHVDGQAVGPSGFGVRAILAVEDDAVVVSASQEPTEVQVLRVGFDGAVTALTSGTAVHGAVAAGGTTVITRSDLTSTAPTVTVVAQNPGRLGIRASTPDFLPAVTLLRAGERELRTAVLFPRGHERGSRRLPVLMDPYGGPHAQRVLANARTYLQSQWLADQGFCVVVADGRGTPGRGRAWDRTVRDDFAGVTLQDQVDALDAVASAFPDDVDTARVGISGWSYGGYLAALAVLARPDVFRAAVAGAPVTDWRLYDTFYTERYLGHPDVRPEVYERNSLVSLASEPLAEGSTFPALMIIHGLVDDNVVVAHSLRLSSALLAAGKPHTVLPLTGVTHMTPQEVVAENLKLLQVDFLKRALHQI